MWGMSKMIPRAAAVREHLRYISQRQEKGSGQRLGCRPVEVIGVLGQEEGPGAVAPSAVLQLLQSTDEALRVRLSGSDGAALRAPGGIDQPFHGRNKPYTHVLHQD